MRSKSLKMVFLSLFALSILFLFTNTEIGAVGSDNFVFGYTFGNSARQEAASHLLYYMDGSTTIGLTLRESDQRDWNILGSIWYETASDVWRQPTADVALKDSDSDGYVDWIGFTATGGATAGGEVRIFGKKVKSFPGI